MPPYLSWIGSVEGRFGKKSYSLLLDLTECETVSAPNFSETKGQDLIEPMMMGEINIPGVHSIPSSYRL